MNFEQYLNDFNSTINIQQFLLNVLVVTVLTYILKKFYIIYGRAVSNREKFSNNFIPLALGTLLIITVIGSSVALSLGLVGALSIVRFRAAIKDPEELIYLFLVIGLGLTGGANKPLLALVSFAIILPILFINSKTSKRSKHLSNSATLHIKTRDCDINSLSNLLAPHTDYLKLKRADISDNILTASYHCTLKSAKSFDTFTAQLKEADASSTISYIDQPDLLL